MHFDCQLISTRIPHFTEVITHLTILCYNAGGSCPDVARTDVTHQFMNRILDLMDEWGMGMNGDQLLIHPHGDEWGSIIRARILFIPINPHIFLIC